MKITNLFNVDSFTVSLASITKLSGAGHLLHVRPNHAYWNRGTYWDEGAYAIGALIRIGALINKNTFEAGRLLERECLLERGR